MSSTKNCPCAFESGTVGNMPPAVGRLGSVSLAVLAGASAWVSLGTMAVILPDTAVRIAALPPLWFLLLLVVVCGVGAWFARLPLARAWPLAITSLLWLPYVPGRVPAAFLTWQGPIEALVWLAGGWRIWFQPNVGCHCVFPFQ